MRADKALKAGHFPIRTSQEFDTLLRSAADGHTSRHWTTNSLDRTRVYRVPGLPLVVRMGLTEEEVAEGIGVEALERFTLGQDADCALAILYVSHLLAPMLPLPQSAAPVGWIDLDDVAQKIGWAARGTAERERNRARIWDYLNYGARAVVSGRRTGIYTDKHTGKVIPTEIEGAIWALHEREKLAQPPSEASAEVPLRVEITMTRSWTRLISEPRTAQYLPLGELLGGIACNQPSGAWARCLGMALANLWRREPHTALDGSLRPTRQALLMHYTPKKAVPHDILNSNDPARARIYWRQALQILLDIGFLADKGEAARKMSSAQSLPRKGWQHAWLDERVALHPGSTLLAAVQACARSKPPRPGSTHLTG